MRRKTLDLLLNWVGVLLIAVFLVAGIGMLVGYSYTTSQVKSQLVEQKVFFPTKTQSDYRDLVAANMTQYAGKEVLTGSQAQIFANDIIGVDTAAISGGQTYAQISAASMAAPSNTSLANQVQLVFRGDTLRGLLERVRLRLHGRHRALWSDRHVRRGTPNAAAHAVRCASLPQDGSDGHRLKASAFQVQQSRALSPGLLILQYVSPQLALQ